MQTDYALNAYRSHDLAIEMRTSSGDCIALELSNEQSLSMTSSQNGKNARGTFSFSSMQSFSFSMTSNGIDAQDRKEIEAFMEIARPYIERFMDELGSGERHTPRNQLAKGIADAFAPARGRGPEMEAGAKQGIVSLFDEAISKIDAFEQLLGEAEKLLARALERFEYGAVGRYA